MRISTVAGILILISSEAAATEWTVETVDGAPDLAAVWATAEGEIWVAGAKSTVRHKKEGAWLSDKLPAPLDWVDVHGTGASDVWAVGSAGGMIRWNGTRWTSIAGVDGDPYVAVAAGASVVAAINEDSVALDQGKGWIFASGKGRPKGLRALGIVGDALFVAVGAGGLAIRVDGAGGAWTPEKTGVDQALNAVAACPGGEAVAVGVSAARRSAAGRWTALTAPPVEVRGAVARCQGKKLERVAAVAGDEVLILDVAKKTWSRQTVASGTTLTDIAPLGAGLVVTGKSGLVATVPSW